MTNNPQLITGDKNRNSFTLIELLVVLALVAILSVVVILTLNPAELIKQARDSNRLSDLSTINTALNLFSADVTGGFMGTSTNVYVSIPSTLSDCSNLGLPTLPAGYAYSCVTSAVNRNTDGTGWIPVNFERISSNSPISQLPIDPQNTTSTKYYTYVTGGSWKVIAAPESQKYLATAGTDGGSNIGQFEVGNNMSLAPFTDGLVGWWKFDEASGITAADSSGWGNTGTATGTTVASGKIGNARSFSGPVDDYINIGDPLVVDPPKATFSFWINMDVLADYGGVFTDTSSNRFLLSSGNQGAALVQNGNGNLITQTIVPKTQWVYLTYVYNGPASMEYIYFNGVEAVRQARSVPVTHGVIYVGRGVGYSEVVYSYGGLIDDFRIYNRALSAAEVLALYNATK